ncbi:hydroxyacylglutathione hydrolase [Gammaproteobacteria bacterium AS21]
MFKVTAIPAFNDNYIWVLESPVDTSQVAVVDPGDAQAVITALKMHNKTLQAILVTHHHDDHTGGVNELREKYDIRVYGPKNCNFSGITHPLEDLATLSLFEKELQIKAVPGHTLDHISYFLAAKEQTQRPQVFCGDTLFLAGCGRVFEGSMQQMLTAMHYFKELPFNTEVYCTHEYSLSNLAFAAAVEPANDDIQQHIKSCTALRNNNQITLPTTIGAELLINPFLRCDQQNVRESAANFAKRTLPSELDVFSCIRQWKNNF